MPCLERQTLASKCNSGRPFFFLVPQETSFSPTLVPRRSGKLRAAATASRAANWARCESWGRPALINLQCVDYIRQSIHYQETVPQKTDGIFTNFVPDSKLLCFPYTS